MLDVPHAFLSNGLIRTDDKRIDRLYQNANKYLDRPCVWEGLFNVACLLKKDPLKEPVGLSVQQAIHETDEGAFNGSFTDQIHIARAAFSLYEYSVDRAILKRIASWFRYLETVFDRLPEEDDVLFHAADLMELLVRYYQATGLKSVLKLCSLLRAASFDWTTALHTFQQAVPVKDNTGVFSSDHFAAPDKITYDQRQKIINHAEWLADGIRYTLFSGIFSGNSRDLSAGNTAWHYLLKKHYALCGGTTGDPFLLGKASDQAVSTCTILAWAEAFASQMLLDNDAWAADELIRIIFNGLDYCLETDIIPERQRVNQLNKQAGNPVSENAAYLYGRLTRAVACVFRHAITVTHDGIRINYLIPCRMIHSFQKQTVILNMTYQELRFECDHPFRASVDLFISARETAEITALCGGKRIHAAPERPDNSRTGIFLRSDRTWLPGDGYHFEQEKKIICEKTSHQGVCFFIRNRLMCLPVHDRFSPVAVCGQAVCSDGRVSVKVGSIDRWKEENGIYRDIPVLPEITGNIFEVQLEPYAAAHSRISMFPRGKQHA